LSKTERRDKELKKFMKAKRSLFKDTFLLSFAKPPNTDSSETEEEESANKSDI